MTRKPPPDTIAQRLTRLREAAGLTPTQLAAKSGISRQLLAKIEAGQQKSPRLADVVKLAKALGKSLAEFDGVG